MSKTKPGIPSKKETAKKLTKIQKIAVQLLGEKFVVVQKDIRKATSGLEAEKARLLKAIADDFMIPEEERKDWSISREGDAFIKAIQKKTEE